MADIIKTPETILIAILHRIGPNVSIVEEKISAHLHSASYEFVMFRPFRFDRYHVSDTFHESLLSLSISSSILKRNEHFEVSPHIVGPYGNNVFMSFTPEEQSNIDVVAKLWPV